MIKKLSASAFALMIKSGANNLLNNKSKVDALNVFPVPDGDTGTNMSLTFKNAANNIPYDSESCDEVAKAAASFTLRGARGNSGVILSQIFRGISSRAKGKAHLSAGDFAHCLKEGSDSAYRAVMKPTEGTILTVIRACADAAIAYDGDGNFIDFLEYVIKEGNATLLKTTEMLPALSQAGVVDAGGQGLMLIFEGMLYYLKNDAVVPSDEAEDETKAKGESAQSKVSTQDIKYTYCTEFIIEKSSPAIHADKMKSAISKIGDCMVVIDDEDIIKVHIHTNNPGFVLEHAVRLGELSTVKIENMKIQHSNIVNNKEEEKPIVQAAPGVLNAAVAVAAGSGVEGLFKDLGASVISGGQTMNPSTDDILSAIDSMNAENIFVLPDNKNIIMAAQQAAKMSEKRVFVIPTKTIPQGISAMVAFEPSRTPEENASAMENAAKKVSTGLITHAVRDTTLDGKEIHSGDILGLVEGDITSVSKDATETAKEIISKIADEDTELITVIYGEDITENEAEALREFVEFKFPDSDVSVYSGGQPVYSYILSAE